MKNQDSPKFCIRQFYYRRLTTRHTLGMLRHEAHQQTTKYAVMATIFTITQTTLNFFSSLLLNIHFLLVHTRLVFALINAKLNNILLKRVKIFWAVLLNACCEQMQDANILYTSCHNLILSIVIFSTSSSEV